MYISCVWGEGVGVVYVTGWVPFSLCFARSIHSLLVCYTHTFSYMSGNFQEWFPRLLQTIPTSEETSHSWIMSSREMDWYIDQPKGQYMLHTPWIMHTNMDWKHFHNLHVTKLQYGHEKAQHTVTMFFTHLIQAWKRQQGRRCS